MIKKLLNISPGIRAQNKQEESLLKIYDSLATCFWIGDNDGFGFHTEMAKNCIEWEFITPFVKDHYVNLIYQFNLYKLPKISSN